MQLWQPPIVHSLIIATSGKFSADGVQWFENHNQKGQLPLIEICPTVISSGSWLATRASSPQKG